MDRWALEWRSTSYAELRIAGGSPVRLLADSQIACDQRHRFPFRKVTPASPWGHDDLLSCVSFPGGTSLKRLVGHGAGLNLALYMRSLIGVGTPQQLTLTTLRRLFRLVSQSSIRPKPSLSFLPAFQPSWALLSFTVLASIAIRSVAA